MKINEFQASILNFEFKSEISKLVSDPNGLVKFHVEHADEKGVKVYKCLPEDKRILMEIKKIDVKKEFGISGGLTTVDLTKLSPQGYHMLNVTIIISSSEIPDAIIDFIPCSYICIKNKKDSELLDDLDKLIKRFNNKKKIDDEEREYDLISNLFKKINN